ncbi:MAG: exosortase-associated EpsI family protein [Anaerolineae bacterium]|nr:exosortase-associated EpsI family protein [Anaerolineae bacterium]
MPERTRRSWTLIVLLLLVVGAMWGVQLGRPNGATGDHGRIVMVADIDTWRRTRRERLVSMPYDLRVTADLASLPLEIGDWTGTDVVDPDPVVVLDPDAYLVRAYEYKQDGVPPVWLSLVASRKLSSFHLPHVCYRGWRTTIRSEAIPLRRGDLYAFSMVAVQGDRTHIVYYMYLWPDQERAIEDGLTMFKVTSSVSTESMAASGDTEQKTREAIHDFIGLWFDSVVEQ